MSLHADWLRPDWQAPGALALMTTRAGGVSAAPFDSMNIRHGLGDDSSHVAENRRRLEAAIASADASAGASAGASSGAGPIRPVYLHQVHGTRVVRLGRADLAACTELEADASVTTDFGVACTAQVADCLPVLFAAPGGVAAAHAGWRGLAAGVLEATVSALCEAADCAPAQLRVWLGPCIGPRHFEVGADVLLACGADPGAALAGPAFSRRSAEFGEGKWLADLPLLARHRLAAAGVGAVSGGLWCTVEAASRFFSYRRDRVTGRMVACVWRRPAGLGD